MSSTSRSKKKITSSASPRWGSRLGFILTAAGAAVGLGNLQRFPQLVAAHGGGAFLLVYIGCIAFFGLPLMLSELALGRASGRAPVGSFEKVVPRSGVWRYVGVLGVLIAFGILSYYTVMCGWTLSFVYKSLGDKVVNYDMVASEPNSVVSFLLIFYVLVTLIVWKGLNKGVERFSKFVMPMLFLIQFLLIFKVLSLPGSLKGLIGYLKPDFSKLHGNSFFIALSQAFFSLCIGEAVLLTYGSFSEKEESLPSSAWYIAFLDTSVAFLAGMLIIPATYITGEDAEQGVGLIYNTLFAIFQQMGGGRIFLVLYFLILAIAGLTTCITLLDVASHGIAQLTRFSKRSSTLLVSFFSLLLGLPSLYSKGGVRWLSEISFLGRKGFCDIMDFVWGDVGMVVCGLLITLFVGWVWGAEKALAELSVNAPFFRKLGKVWVFHIKWTAPLMIVSILVTMFF